MKTVIPLTLEELRNNGVEEYIKRVKECSCKSVTLSLNSTQSFEYMEKEGRALKAFSDRFNDEGIETSVWIHPTLGLVPFKEHTLLTPLKNAPIKGKCCPMDDDYCADAAHYIEVIARSTKSKSIGLEDDFRMQFPSLSATCFCEHHMKFYSEYIGRKVTKEEVEENLFDKNNIYREAWVKGLQAGLKKLAKALREGVDRVDENIEIIFATGPANCGADGTDMFELIDILRGKHKEATIRLSGGPYWQEGFYLTRNMMAAVELERYTALKCRQHNVTGRAEGDVFPRPRHLVPSSHLEIFHTALMFDGNAGEILKYMLDYTASPNYEKGYTNAHIKNMKLYEKIEEIIKETRLTGFNPVEDFNLHRYSHKMQLNPETEIFESCVRNFCTDNALPTAHEGGGVNILFGDRAREVDLSLLENGSIIDIVAAKALMERGIDVGIEKCEDRVFASGREYYPSENENVSIAKSFDIVKPELKENAQVKSVFIPGETGILYHSVKGGAVCDGETPSAYLYENKDGLKFLVFNFDASQCSTRRAGQGVFNNYCRQRVIFDSYEWLHGKPLAAYCKGHPWLYTMVRENESKCVIGLWNHFADDIDMPVIETGTEYKTAEFISCEGRLEGNKAVITSGIGAYKFCFVELKK